jgi:hypothetical protein
MRWLFLSPRNLLGNDAQENDMASPIRQLLQRTALVLGVLALLLPQTARADMELTFQEDAGPVVIVDVEPSFTGLSYNKTFGDFKVQFFGATADNATPLSDLMSSTTSLKNTDSKKHTLKIGVTETDYTLPGSAGSTLDMTSHIGGTVTAGGAGQALTFQSYATNSNADFDTGGVTDGPQSPIISVTKSSFDSMPDPSAAFPRTSGMYSVTTYNTITLVPGGIINFSTSTTLELAAVTPAPAGLVLACAACPALGLGAWVRRRRCKKSPS